MLNQEKTLEEINAYLNEIIKTNLGSLTKKDLLKQMGQKYRKTLGVYKITNVVNQRVYIGSTTDDGGLIGRLKRHFSDLRNGIHCNRHLQRAFNIYGEDKFTCEIVEFFVWDENKSKVENKTALEKREQFYMDLYEVRNEAKGYNEADHAHGGFNWLTWDTLETRSDITKDQLELIIDKLVNTNTICRLIDEEVGVKLGTSRKIYNRQIFAKITEGYVFQYRNNKSVGENSVNAKLNEAQVKEIIERLKIGDPIPKIAKDYGVIRAAIHDIKNGDNWAHLTKRIKFYDYPKVKKDSELLSVYQYSLDGSYQKEWANYREAARYYGVSTTTVKQAIKIDALYSINHLWSFEKKDFLKPKVPITLFFYYQKDGKERALFEVNGGKPCECCATTSVPVALYDWKNKKYLWAWESKANLAKVVTGKGSNTYAFKEHTVFQNRYEIIPMREIPEQDLLLIKDLLENGEEMDYSILGYNPNTYSNKTKFPILPENQTDYIQV